MGYSLSFNINDKVILAKFDSMKEMNSSLVRIQESYENPDFVGKCFTIEEFRTHYKNKFGRYSYNSTVEGMNFSGCTLWPFRLGFFNPLSKKEKEFLTRTKFMTDKHYFIAHAKNSPSGTGQHECSHALYFTVEEYRDKVNDVLMSTNLSKLNQFLYDQEYNDSVLLDEAHAWLLTEWNQLKGESSLNLNELSQIREYIIEIYNEHMFIQEWVCLD